MSESPQRKSTLRKSTQRKSILHKSAIRKSTLRKSTQRQLPSKKCSRLTEERDPAPEKPKEQCRTPTNFLSLPRELRHDILLRSGHSPNFVKYKYENLEPLMQQWATLLRSVHPDIVEDVEYVRGKWLEDLDTIWERVETGDSSQLAGWTLTYGRFGSWMVSDGSWCTGWMEEVTIASGRLRFLNWL